MQSDRPSITSLVVAYARAYQAMTNPISTVFLDPIAPRLITDDERKQFDDVMLLGARATDPEGVAACPDEASLLEFATRATPARSMPLSRARFVEDGLHAAIAHGVRQYVLVGAGLDTFAWRHPELADRLAIFEIDHPATQADKRVRLARAGLAEPPHVHFVPLDFTVTPIDEALAATPFDPTQPAYFTWTGVTYYLPRVAVDGTLAAMHRCTSARSHVAFDYLEAAAFGPDASPAIARSQAILQMIGEPLVTVLDPVTLASDLAALGWTLELDLAPPEIEATYLHPTMPGYQAPQHFHLARAMKGPAS